MLVSVPLTVMGRVVVPLTLPEVIVVVWSAPEVGTSISTILVDVPLRTVATVEV